MDDSATRHREVVAEALRILRLLQDDRQKLCIQSGALDMLHLSISLRDLEMWEDAEITCTWAANLYRTLVRGNVNPFLPYLAITLDNLGISRESIYDHNGMLTASQESVATYRILKDTQIWHNVTQGLARALAHHAHALNHVGRFEDGLAAAQESVTILRNLVSEDLATKTDSTSTSSSVNSESESEEWSGDDDEIENLGVAEDKAKNPAVIDTFSMLEYDLALAIHCLSDCLSYTGRDSDAYDAAKEALNVFRFVSEFYPGTIDVDLAQILYDISRRLWRMDQPLDALPLMEEAVGIYRILAQRRPSSFSVHLIMALYEFATLLRETGRDDDALAAGDEAVRSYRNHLGNRPDFALCLPDTFDHYSYLLRDLGRHDEALVISTEAADTYRTLINDFPALAPSFATELNALAWDLHRANRLEDATAICKEAVAVYRTLVKGDPAVYSLYLAWCLATLATYFYDARQYNEGIEAGKEAVELYRAVIDGRPDLQDAFLTTLEELWLGLEEANCLQDGIVIGAEVICVYRTMAEGSSTDFPRQLVGALLGHSNNLYRNGQYHDALIADEEAVHLCRSFECSDSACDFVYAANRFGIGLYEVGQVEQAIAICQEAITIGRDIIGDHPRITSTFVSLLANLSDCFCSQGQFDEALILNEEAVSRSRSIPSEKPAELAFELRELSMCLLKAGRPQDALQASEEAVETCRKLPPSEDVSSALAYSLDSLSNCLADIGREEDALVAAEEAVMLYRQIIPDSRRRTGCHDRNVADALYDFAARLATAGRLEDALANTRDAASMYRTVVTTRAGHLPKYATVVHSLAVWLWDAGCQDEAIGSWKEEVIIRQRLASTNPDLTPMLDDALCTLSARLSEMNRLTEAPVASLDARKVRDKHLWVFEHLPLPNANGVYGVAEGSEGNEKGIDGKETTGCDLEQSKSSAGAWSFATLKAVIVIPFIGIWFSLFHFWIVVTT